MPVCKADFTRWRSNPVIRPRIKKVAVRRFFLFCERIRMRTGEKAGRTAVKRQTEVCRSAKQILQGGEAIRAEAPATVGLFYFLLTNLDNTIFCVIIVLKIKDFNMVETKNASEQIELLLERNARLVDENKSLKYTINDIQANFKKSQQTLQEKLKSKDAIILTLQKELKEAKKAFQDLEVLQEYNKRLNEQVILNRNASEKQK